MGKKLRSHILRSKTEGSKLDLSDRSLKSLPEEVFEWHELKTLIAGRNALKSLTAAVTHLSALRTLSVRENKVEVRVLDGEAYLQECIDKRPPCGLRLVYQLEKPESRRE